MFAFYINSKSNKLVQGISFGHIGSKLNSYLLNSKKQINLIVEINENFWNNKKYLQINAIDAIEIFNKAWLIIIFTIKNSNSVPSSIG